MPGGPSGWRSAGLTICARRSRPPPADPAVLQPTALVTFNRRQIGYRRVVTGRLWQGDVIWARTRRIDGEQVTVEEVSLSAIWRHPGWPEGESDGWRTLTQASGPRERGYRATCWPAVTRIRCARRAESLAAPISRAGTRMTGLSSAPTQAMPASVTVLRGAGRAGADLARAAGGPRPGAGQFYLDYGDRRPAGENRQPTREWGSDPDVPHPRRLRGRKFYWHATPDTQNPPRHIARKHQREGNLATQQWIAPAGTTITQRITFDNLPPDDLGGLLAAFEPGRILLADGGPLSLHLGSGKPLGLGSCTAAISELRVWDAASRYGSGAKIQPDKDTYIEAFRQSCISEVTATWEALAAVLTARNREAPYVWYPPGVSWVHSPATRRRSTSRSLFSRHRPACSSPRDPGGNWSRWRTRAKLIRACRSYRWTSRRDGRPAVPGRRGGTNPALHQPHSEAERPARRVVLAELGHRPGPAHAAG